MSRKSPGRAMWIYEHRTQRLLTRAQFTRRILHHVGFVAIAVAIALAIGVAGYHYLGALDWLDALLNASMILGGMGPVDTLKTDAVKLFASLYALFSGLFFIAIASLLVAPFVHRLMHRLHVEELGK